MKLLLPLLFVLAACGKEPQPEHTFFHMWEGYGVPSEYIPLLEGYYRNLPSDLNIVEMDTYGKAYANAKGESDFSYCHIVVYPANFNRLSDLEKKFVLFHELEHCGQVQHKDEDVDGIPTSIMNPVIPTLAQLAIIINYNLAEDVITKYVTTRWKDEILDQSRVECRMYYLDCHPW